MIYALKLVAEMTDWWTEFVWPIEPRIAGSGRLFIRGKFFSFIVLFSTDWSIENVSSDNFLNGFRPEWNSLNKNPEKGFNNRIIFVF